jgi:PAS domain S-box-containing protein
LNALLDNLTSGVFMVDAPSGRPIIANPAAQRLLGRGILPDCSKENLSEVYRAHKPGSSASYPVEEMPIVRGMYGEATHIDDLIVERPDGTEAWLEIFGSPVRDEQGQVWASLVSFHDISRRKRAEEELRLFRQVLEDSSDAVGIATPQGMHYYQNRAFDALFGPVSENRPETLHVDSAVGRQVMQAIIAGGQWTGEAKMHARDGRILDILLRAYAVRDTSGGITALVGIHTDITERKRVEERLQESEERYRNIFEHSIAGIYQATPEGRYITMNPAFAAMFGYASPEEMISTVTDIAEQLYVNPENRRTRVARMETSNGVVRDYRVQLKRKDGSLFWVLVTARMVRNRKDGSFFLEGTCIDITERKKAEEASRESQFRAIVESTGNGVLVIDRAGRVILSNRRFAELWNVPGHLLATNSDEDLIAHASDQLLDPDAFLNKVRFLYQSTASDYDEILLKDGRILQRYSYPLLNEGVVMGRVWSFRDITEGKRNEIALRDSEQLFRTAFSMSPALMGFYRLADGAILEINEKISDYAGYRKEEVLGRRIDELGLMEPAFLRKLRKVFSEQGVISNEEIQYKTRTGEVRCGLYSAALIGSVEEGRVLGLLFDITERKQSEAQLKLREQEAQRLVNNLEEANIALRVVLSRHENDQKMIEEKIQLNLKEVVFPFINSLKGVAIDQRGKRYLDLLEANLKSILSPFVRNMTNTYEDLTPRETQIAEMIRQGMNSKEIAGILGTSVATINTQRNNIRKKLNLRTKKTNLRSHLLSHS